MIVSIVGKSKLSETIDDGPLQTLAASVVTALPQTAIVLTGGRADERKPSVKRSAMLAAQKTDRRGVGILGKALAGENNVGSCHYIGTVLDSERNLLTGALADVVIALRGAGGTLSEIYFADLFGRPVLFQGWSREQFERDLVDGLQDATDHVNEVRKSLPLDIGPSEEADIAAVLRRVRLRADLATDPGAPLPKQLGYIGKADRKALLEFVTGSPERKWRDVGATLKTLLASPGVM